KGSLFSRLWDVTFSASGKKKVRSSNVTLLSFFASGDWRQVEAIDNKCWLRASKIGLANIYSDLALFSRKQRNVVVPPEDRQYFSLLFALHEAEPSEKGDALSGVFDTYTERGVVFATDGRVKTSPDRGFRQILQRRKV